MTIFEKADYLIKIIENAGYEAYLVGGCVRDFFMNKSCNDIDITTSAKPIELEKILTENKIKYIETGLKHGTVTALIESDSFEITTYRTDGEYSDNRHPENVKFVSNIDDDLSLPWILLLTIALILIKMKSSIYSAEKKILKIR